MEAALLAEADELLQTADDDDDEDAFRNVLVVLQRRMQQRKIAVAVALAIIATLRTKRAYEPTDKPYLR